MSSYRFRSTMQTQRNWIAAFVWLVMLMVCGVALYFGAGTQTIGTIAFFGPVVTYTLGVMTTHARRTLQEHIDTIDREHNRVNEIEYQKRLIAPSQLADKVLVPKVLPPEVTVNVFNKLHGEFETIDGVQEMWDTLLIAIAERDAALKKLLDTAGYEARGAMGMS